MRGKKSYEAGHVMSLWYFPLWVHSGQVQILTLPSHKLPELCDQTSLTQRMDRPCSSESLGNSRHHIR